MHRQNKNMDDQNPVQNEWRQNRSSSLSLFVFLETFHCFPLWFNYSWLSQHPLPWLCQEPWVILDPELSTKKHLIKICQLLTSNLNVLVQSVLVQLLLPISSHGLTTATVSSRVHLILSSNLSIKFKTFLQNSSLFLGTLPPPPLLEKLHWLPISKHIKYT